ncbi:PP-loop family domain-containing protein [Ditylenchus destructor]|nr:PP-loop family domain-containing protein [Ditylenchus destructor]
MMKCVTCEQSAKIKTAKTGEPRCVDCFLPWFEKDVHRTIDQLKLFSTGECVAVGVSGGKDSTVLASILHTLNQRYSYGLNLVLLCIDEGIVGYRDDSIRELYGWTMDEIVAKIGKKNNCTFCGVFRRQALDRGALKVGACKIVTGHNADDLAETFLMNVLRGDVSRLQRSMVSVSSAEGNALPRVKPLKYSYEKDIVMYAHFKKLNYFSTECIYSPNSYRGNARTFIKDLERERPRVVLDLIRSGESIAVRGDVVKQVLGECERCGYISSQRFCKACLLLYGLNNSNYSVGICPRKGRLSPSIIMESEEKLKANDIQTECGGSCACDKTPIDF